MAIHTLPRVGAPDPTRVDKVGACALSHNKVALLGFAPGKEGDARLSLLFSPSAARALAAELVDAAIVAELEVSHD